MLCFVDGWLLYRSSRVVKESGSLESTRCSFRLLTGVVFTCGVAIMKCSYAKKKIFGNQHF